MAAALAPGPVAMPHSQAPLMPNPHMAAVPAPVSGPVDPRYRGAAGMLAPNPYHAAAGAMAPAGPAVGAYVAPAASTMPGGDLSLEFLQDVFVQFSKTNNKK